MKHLKVRGDRALLQEICKVLGGAHQAQKLPDYMEGAVGHTEILKKLWSLYAALYNFAGTEDQLEALKILIDSKIDCRSEYEVRKFYIEQVKYAC